MVSSVDVEAALHEIDQSGRVPGWIRDDPGGFLSDLYALWVANGGRVSGKNRNSIRNLMAWLGPTSQVKSLPQKLRGAVKLKETDATVLVHEFLKRWKPLEARAGHVGTADTGYQPFPSEERALLVDNLIRAMYAPDREGANRHIQLRETRAQRANLSDEIVSPEVYKRMLAGADALVVFSRHRSVASESFLAQAMEGFWQILRGFSDVLKEDERQRTIIWVLNIGNRQVEDKNAWRDFINVEILKAQLEAFAHFDSQEDLRDNSEDNSGEDFADLLDNRIRKKIEMPSAEYRIDRWKRLIENSVLIIEHLRDEEINTLFPEEMKEDKAERVKDIGVFAEHLLPHALPPAWTNITRLYRDEMKSVSDATFAAMLHLPKSKDETSPRVEYYAYAPLHRGPTRGRIMQVPLAPPGEAYDDAFHLAYLSARYRLKDRFGNASKKKASGRTAVRYLRKLGFEVLTVPDLFRLFSGDYLIQSKSSKSS